MRAAQFGIDNGALIILVTFTAYILFAAWRSNRKDK